MFSEESIYSFPTSSETDERLLSQNYTLKYMLLISKRDEFACVYLFRIGIQKGGEMEKLNWSLEQALKKVTRRLKNQVNIRKYAMTAIVKEW